MAKIIYDMDSMMADFFFATLEAYEADTGEKLDPAYIVRWDTKFPNGKSQYDYFRQPGFFRRLRLIQGAERVMKKYYLLGHDTIIASAATLTNAPGEKYEWLSEHIPWLSRDNVFFGKMKWMLRGDFLIDDHAGNTGRFKQENPGATTIGIKYPYNIGQRKDFDFLVPSYLDFEGAWSQIDRIISANLD